MDVQVRLLEKMLQRLSAETGLALDHAGLAGISGKVFENGNERYLYHNIYQKMNKAKPEDTIGLQENRLNEIAKFLGYPSFRELKSHLENPEDPVLRAMHGNYYCYVRASHEEGYILRSPVNIAAVNGKTWLRLKGMIYSFEGEVALTQGCLFVLMQSIEGKSFYHVYRIGTRKSPDVLQGVFAGVSTAFDPIAGRTVLVRQNDSFDSLVNLKIAIAELDKSESRTDRILAEYFREYSKNNISTKKSAGFSWEDLAG